MLGELIIVLNILGESYQVWIYWKRGKCNVFQVSIKEGDEEKVDEMRGREKLVRTPQQVIVVFLFYFFYICMLVYLYLGCISMAFPLYFYWTLLWSWFLFVGEQQRAWMLRRSCILPGLDLGRLQNETFGIYHIPPNISKYIIHIQISYPSKYISYSFKYSNILIYKYSNIWDPNSNYPNTQTSRRTEFVLQNY